MDCKPLKSLARDRNVGSSAYEKQCTYSPFFDDGIRKMIYNISVNVLNPVIEFVLCLILDCCLLKIFARDQRMGRSAYELSIFTLNIIPMMVLINDLEPDSISSCNLNTGYDLYVPVLSKWMSGFETWCPYHRRADVFLTSTNCVFLNWIIVLFTLNER